MSVVSSTVQATGRSIHGLSDLTRARVLFGIDFGSASLAAARWAVEGVAMRAEAIFAHIVGGRDEADDSDDSRHVLPAIRGGLGGFAATLGTGSARTIVRFGRPSEGLSAIANDAEAALIVMGRRADARRTRMGEPNVLERVARRTSASVLVVPEGNDAPPARVIAAVDESGFAPRVLAVARRLARIHEIPLLIFHALSPLVGAYAKAGRGDRVPQGRLLLPSRTGRWLADLGQSHNVLGQDRTELVVGDPVREVTAAAMENERSLVVVGMRGADSAPVGSVGSVARELLTRAPMPVLVVNGI